MLLQNIALINEFAEFKNTIDVELRTPIEIISKNGDIVFPLESSSNIVSSMREALDKMLDSDRSHYRESYLGELADDLVMVPFTSRSEADTLLKEILMQIRNDPKFMGMLVLDSTNSNYVINITHPVVMLSYLAGIFQLPERGKFVIYALARGEHAMYERPHIKDRATDHWTQIVAHLGYSYISQIEVNASDTAYFSEPSIYDIYLTPIDESFDPPAAIIPEPELTNITREFYIPLQVLVGSVAAPYYGDIYVKQDGEGIHGVNTTGNISGAIRQRTFTMSSVCTGEFSRHTYRGLQTLSKINVSSLHTSDFVSQYWYEISRSAIEVATSLLLDVKVDEDVDETIDEDVDEAIDGDVDEAIDFE